MAELLFHRLAAGCVAWRAFVLLETVGLVEYFSTSNCLIYIYVTSLGLQKIKHILEN